MSKSTTIELVIQVIANQISGNPNLSMAIDDSNEVNEKTYVGVTNNSNPDMSQAHWLIYEISIIDNIVMVLNTGGAYDKIFNDRKTLSYG